MSALKTLLLVLTAPIWIPVGFLIGAVLWVALPMLFQLVVVFGGLGAIWILIEISKIL